MAITIRQETINDYSAVRDVIISAFQDVMQSSHDEHLLVERLRRSAAFVPELSLVAEMDGSIVGYVLFSTVFVGQHQLLALAPLAVRPLFQRQGIGKALVNAGHAIAQKMPQYKASVVLGEPVYYSRLGYQPASLFGIFSPKSIRDGRQFSDQFYRIFPFFDDALRDVHGTVEYSPAFFEAS